jgi:hypothetical protein
MSIQHANRGVVKKDLQLYYNREFSKSFRGEATTNLYSTVGGGAANTYPSSGNSWGTYRDSLYNGGAFASIGTIASVSGNVITVSSPTAYFNSFATYDVIRPQTTGGGLTANTDYYFKRLSSTTFTLHQYDSTNNASKTPEQILTYISSDTRISVNATSFPTMWWGYPHLPNVALIKTAITDGFAYDNRLHDCLRLNWFRSDRTDGMAYGVQPAYTANTQYVFTAYIKASSQNAIGGTVAISAYQTGTATYPTITGASSPVLTSNWQKWTGTFTSSATGGSFFFYFFPSIATLPATVDIAELQLEQKSYATEFTPTSRSANTVAGGGGLLDISGNSVNADLTNVSFDSTGYIFTAASSNRIQFTTPTSFIYSAAGKTVLMWIKYNSTGYVGFCGLGNAASGQSFNLRSTAATTQYLGFMGYNADYDPSVGPQINNNVWHLIGATFDAYGAGNLKLYVDGANIASTTSTLNTAPEASNIGYIGRSSHGGGNEGYLTGQVGQFMMYNRALSADEVLQIFNSQRKTYGV